LNWISYSLGMTHLVIFLGVTNKSKFGTIDW